MTNSMIPYSFVPGTKAKASEVNANFISLADIIAQNQTTVSGNIQNLQGQLNTLSTISENKADKSELINEYTISETGTDLDDYLTKGCYVFSDDYTPLNIPKGDSGMLFVDGKSDSIIKQIWFCNETVPEIFTRNYENSEWSDWISYCGDIDAANNPGYLKLANGIIIQWGYQDTFGNKVYPIAYSSFVSVVVTKQGLNSGYTRTDGGLETQSLTGFAYRHFGHCENQNWIAIGM